MTPTADQYVARVIDNMPRATPLRLQIETELRSLIADRVARGQPLADVLTQLGDPGALADSYLAEVPLVAASFWRRGGAKMLDLVTLACAGALVGLGVGRVGGVAPFGIAAGFLFLALFFGLYNVLTEWYYGETLGKHLLGLRVVRESGARISFGQALVRQLPQWLEVFWIDVLFAAFTERKQRAWSSPDRVCEPASPCVRLESSPQGCPKLISMSA